MATRMTMVATSEETNFFTELQQLKIIVTSNLFLMIMIQLMLPLTNINNSSINNRQASFTTTSTMAMDGHLTTILVSIQM